MRKHSVPEHFCFLTDSRWFDALTLPRQHLMDTTGEILGAVW
jgi:hypothetical protein